MKREILCPECGADYFLLRVDRQRGFVMRRTDIPKVKCPPGIGVQITTTQAGSLTLNADAISTLIDTNLWLCHVCQALSEENEETRRLLAQRFLP